jgi:hypothetical protein
LATTKSTTTATAREATGQWEAVGVGAHEAKAFHSNLAIKSSFMLPQNAEIDVISAF